MRGSFTKYQRTLREELDPYFETMVLTSKKDIKKITDKREYLKDAIPLEDKDDFNPEVVEVDEESDQVQDQFE